MSIVSKFNFMKRSYARIKENQVKMQLNVKKKIHKSLEIMKMIDWQSLKIDELNKNNNHDK